MKEFNGVLKTNFLDDRLPKEGMHHTCIACISTDSIMKMKKNPQVYLAEYKYRVKKKKMPE